MWRDVLIGTYTWREAEGIYRGRFDDETGAFETLKLAVTADNPAFLAARGDMLYAVNEQREGGVSAFRRTGVDLDFVNAQASGGSLPCHVSAGPDWVAVANYGSGTVALFPTAADDGRLLPMADSRQHRGNGPIPPGRKAPTRTKCTRWGQRWSSRTWGRTRFIATASRATGSVMTVTRSCRRAPARVTSRCTPRYRFCTC